MTNPITVGAVAYDPKVVTIWEMIREYFLTRGVLNDFVLFSNYEAQVEALLRGFIDIAWNTNLAYVRVHRRTQGRCRVIAMRDTDVEFTSVIVARTDAGISKLADLKGKTVAFGSRDSGQAAILPAYFLKVNGVDPQKDIRSLRFDLDVGKHGDTGTSEIEVLNAVVEGKAEAGAVGDQYWARALSEHLVDRDTIKAIWTSPHYCHCNFTILEDRYAPDIQLWTDVLLLMDYNEPEHRRIMDLEGLKRWVGPHLDGYKPLFEAVDTLGYFATAT
jgi:phosphate/phosphite/phosphonate ABC transporter binding protein